MRQRCPWSRTRATVSRRGRYPYIHPPIHGTRRIGHPHVGSYFCFQSSPPLLAHDHAGWTHRRMHSLPGSVGPSPSPSPSPRFTWATIMVKPPTKLTESRDTYKLGRYIHKSPFRCQCEGDDSYSIRTVYSENVLTGVRPAIMGCLASSYQGLRRRRFPARYQGLRGDTAEIPSSV